MVHSVHVSVSEDAEVWRQKCILSYCVNYDKYTILSNVTMMMDMEIENWAVCLLLPDMHSLRHIIQTKAA
jgi:hypothetical protein